MARDINSILTPLTAPKLGDASFAIDFETWCNNINANFQTIASAPYLKGDRGDSVHTVELVKGSSRDYDDLRSAIIDKLNSVFGGDCSNDKLFVTGHNSIDDISDRFVVFKDDYNGKLYLTAPIFFIDARINDLPSVTEVTNLEDFIDKTIAIYGIATYQNGKYSWILDVKSIIPTLYYDDTQRQFCWMVNGNKTGIIAQGLKGDKGEAARPVRIVSGHKDGINSNKIVVTHEYVGNNEVPDAQSNDSNATHTNDQEDKGLIPISSDRIKDGDLVLVMIKPDSEQVVYTGIIYSIIHVANPGEYYVIYYSERDIIKIVNSAKLRDLLNQVGAYPSDYDVDTLNSMRGLYLLGHLPVATTIEDNDLAHMMWVKQVVGGNSDEIHHSLVNYADTAMSPTGGSGFQSEPTPLSGGKFHIDYDETYINGKLETKGDTSINGKLEAKDTIIKGKLEARGNTTIKGNTSITGGLTTGTTTINGGLTVNNSSTFNKEAIFNDIVRLKGKTFASNISSQTSSIDSDYGLAARFEADPTNIDATIQVDNSESGAELQYTGVLYCNLTLGYVGYKNYLLSNHADRYKKKQDVNMIRAIKYPINLWIDTNMRDDVKGSFLINYLGHIYNITVIVSKAINQGSIDFHISANISKEEGSIRNTYSLTISSDYIMKIANLKLLHNYVDNILFISDSFNPITINEIEEYTDSSDEKYHKLDKNLDCYMESVIGSNSTILKTGIGANNIYSAISTGNIVKDIMIYPEGIVGYREDNIIPSTTTYSGIYRNGSMINSLYSGRTYKRKSWIFLNMSRLILTKPNTTFTLTSILSTDEHGQNIYDTNLSINYITTSGSYKTMDIDEQGHEITTIRFSINNLCNIVRVKINNDNFIDTKNAQLIIQMKDSEQVSIVNKSFKLIPVIDVQTMNLRISNTTLTAPDTYTISSKVETSPNIQLIVTNTEDINTNPDIEMGEWEAGINSVTTTNSTTTNYPGRGVSSSLSSRVFEYQTDVNESQINSVVQQTISSQMDEYVQSQGFKEKINGIVVEMKPGSQESTDVESKDPDPFTK